METYNAEGYNELWEISEKKWVKVLELIKTNRKKYLNSLDLFSTPEFLDFKEASDKAREYYDNWQNK